MPHSPIKATAPGGGRVGLSIDELTIPEWEAQAACGQPGTGAIWFLPDAAGPPSPSTRLALEFGAEICNTSCPVKAECRADSTPEDRRYTTRGGFLPENYSGRPVGRPGKVQAQLSEYLAGNAEPMDLPDLCRSGHDRSVVGRTSSGGCRECSRLSKMNRRRAAGVAPARPTTAVLTAVQVESGSCPQGHPVSLSDASLMASGQCRDCWLTHRREWDRAYRADGRRTHPDFCSRGHAWTPGNTKIYKDRKGTRRECVECRRLRRLGATNDVAA